jgi:hypothetical protein
VRSIYLFNIKNTDIYKIGFTRKDPQLRVEALQTGNPFEIVYVNHYETERATTVESVLHRRYQHKKVTEEYENIKGEWFVLEQEQVESFYEDCEKIDKNLQVIEENSTLFD